MTYLEAAEKIATGDCSVVNYGEVIRHGKHNYPGYFALTGDQLLKLIKVLWFALQEAKSNNTEVK